MCPQIVVFKLKFLLLLVPGKICCPTTGGIKAPLKLMIMFKTRRATRQRWNNTEITDWFLFASSLHRTLCDEQNSQQITWQSQFHRLSSGNPSSFIGQPLQRQRDRRTGTKSKEGRRCSRRRNLWLGWWIDFRMTCHQCSQPNTSG